MIVNLLKTKVMVSSGITQDGLSKSKVDPCEVYSLKVKANSVLCVQCDRWAHGKCVGVKRVTPKRSRNFTCRKCDGNIGESVKSEEKLCDEVEIVQEFTYLGDMVSAGGGCEAAVPARTRCGLIFLKCGVLLYLRRFPLWLKGAVYESYIWPAKLYGSEAWCLMESEMGILQRVEKSMVTAMCGIQLKHRIGSMDLMFMLGLKIRSIDQLSLAKSVC